MAEHIYVRPVQEMWSDGTPYTIYKFFRKKASGRYELHPDHLHRGWHNKQMAESRARELNREG
jgi:hypothetical protein